MTNHLIPAHVPEQLAAAMRDAFVALDTIEWVVATHDACWNDVAAANGDDRFVPHVADQIVNDAARSAGCDDLFDVLAEIGRVASMGSLPSGQPADLPALRARYGL